MKRRRFLVLSAGCMMGLLSACGLPMSENVQVEELLRAPRLPGDYGALQNALNEWLGESAQLKYPMQGELLSPFLLQDLDGDGQQDAAVLYTTAQSSNVCIAFLQKNAAGVWQVHQSIEGLADTVDNVRLAQLQDGAATQLVVGYLAAQGDSYLAVYSYENGTVNAILEQSYEQYLVEDITGGGNQDLILMSTLEDGGVQIELLTVDKEGSFQQVAVMGLSANRVWGRTASAIWCWTAGPAFRAIIWPRCCSILMRTVSRCCPRSRSAPVSCTMRLCAMSPRWSAGIWTATASWRSPPSPTKQAC